MKPQLKDTLSEHSKTHWVKNNSIEGLGEYTEQNTCWVVDSTQHS